MFIHRSNIRLSDNLIVDSILLSFENNINGIDISYSSLCKLTLIKCVNIDFSVCE